MSFLRKPKEREESTEKILVEIQSALNSIERRLSAIPESLQEPLRAPLRTLQAQVQASLEELRGMLADTIELLQN
ncbi:MAG: hypothetical protein ACPLRJ_06615, partial [Infirmifilum uzonense]|uniref:hypothetical protein n=1 Tax=Infirmifilum uzonense TaxID=1550241 RepID=UPI003C78D764